MYLSWGFSCPQHCCFFWITFKIISDNAHIGLSTLCYSYSFQILSEVRAELEMFPPIPASSFSPILGGTDLNVVCGQVSLVCILAPLYLARVDLPSSFAPFNPNTPVEEWVADFVHWQEFWKKQGWEKFLWHSMKYKNTEHPLYWCPCLVMNYMNSIMGREPRLSLIFLVSFLNPCVHRQRKCSHMINMQVVLLQARFAGLLTAPNFKVIDIQISYLFLWFFNCIQYNVGNDY